MIFKNNELVPNNPKVPYTKDLNLINEYDYQHYMHRLYIYWDVCTVCNFHCSYCYARQEYTKKEWNQVYPWSHQLLVLQALKQIKLPIFLGFHGGEPSIHPKFVELVHETTKILTHPDSRLYIVTNGMSDNLLKIPFNHKVYFLMSSHMENKAKYGHNYEKYLHNVRTLHERGFKVKCNILLIPKEEYYEDIHFLYRELKKIGVMIHPHFIYDINNGQEQMWEYPKEFYDEFSELDKVDCKFVFETDQNTHVELSDYELFKHELYHFKGWKCWNNNYEIKYDGILHQICSNDWIDLKKNPLYFRHFKFEPMICPFDNCLSDGVLKVLKEKS